MRFTVCAKKNDNFVSIGTEDFFEDIWKTDGSTIEDQGSLKIVFLIHM
jgi:hypothetical protein